MNMDNVGGLIETTKGIKQGNVIEGWGGEAPWRRDSLRMTRNCHTDISEAPGRGTIKGKIAREGRILAELRSREWGTVQPASPQVLLDLRRDFGAYRGISSSYDFI